MRHLLNCELLIFFFLILVKPSTLLGIIIVVSSLKILSQNIYSEESYDKANMRTCALSLCGNSIWGLTYFDQFISRSKHKNTGNIKR